MSWFKIDDTFGTHPKVLGIPRSRRKAAVGLWTLAGNWCARNLTDGAIPAYMIDELGGEDDEVKDLLSARLWEETPDGFHVHDYLVYNPSREKVLAERAAASERQRQARERAAAKRRAQEESSQRESRRDVSTNGDAPSESVESTEELPLGVLSQRDSHRESRVTEALRHGAPDRESQPPDPTRPDPTRKEKRTKGAASGAAKPTPEGRIADAVYDRLEGMVTWPAIQQVAKRALRVQGATEDSVIDAMCGLYGAGRPITLQTVGQVLSGAISLRVNGAANGKTTRQMSEAELRMHALNPHVTKGATR